MDFDDELKYSYSTKPRPVQTNRSKGRDVPAAKPPGPNIMHDPRIIRGSIFASHSMATPNKRNQEESEKKKQRRRSSSAKPRNLVYAAAEVPSYQFAPFSLEDHLVEKAPVVLEQDAYSQTDVFKPHMISVKGLSPDGVFLRPKVGVDSSTQIEDSDKLFEFNSEVKPLLNVLVNKTIAQALAEVKEEQEMVSITRQRVILLAQKAEAARADREMEEKAKEAFRHKEQVKLENQIKQQQRKVMQEKFNAWQLAHALVPQAILGAKAELEKKGVFYDPVQRDLAQWLLRDIYSGVDAKVRLRCLSATLFDGLLEDALRRQSIFTQLLPHEEEALVRILLKEPLFGSNEDQDGGNSAFDVRVIGPIALSRRDSMEIIEEKIQFWITENVSPNVRTPVGGYLSILSLAEAI